MLIGGLESGIGQPQSYWVSLAVTVKLKKKSVCFANWVSVWAMVMKSWLVERLNNWHNNGKWEHQRYIPLFREIAQWMSSVRNTVVNWSQWTLISKPFLCEGSKTLLLPTFQERLAAWTAKTMTNSWQPKSKSRQTCSANAGWIVSVR